MKLFQFTCFSFRSGCSGCLSGYKRDKWMLEEENIKEIPLVINVIYKIVTGVWNSLFKLNNRKN